jgi:hypothetical protein
LFEEDDYLNRVCGDEDFAERVKTESEQRLGSAAMSFDRNRQRAMATPVLTVSATGLAQDHQDQECIPRQTRRQ